VVYLFESFELDEDSFCLMQAGERVPLEPKSLRVLLLLLQSGGKLVEKDKILSSVWKDTFVEETTLTRAIALIRKQLDDDPRRPQFIETVPTLGYRFIAKVETRASGDALKTVEPRDCAKIAQTPLPDAALQIQEPRSAWARAAGALVGSRLGKTGWIVAVALLVVATGLSFFVWHHEAEEPPVLRYTLQMPEGAILDFAALPAISPDGRYVVTAATVSGKRGLWLRGLNELKAHLLSDTDDAALPFWSPDGRWIGFFGQDRILKKIRVEGGPAFTLCACPAGRLMGGAWNSEDLIVFGTVDGLFLLPAGGGTRTLLIAPDPAAGEAARRTPWFLPDGRHFLFTARNADPNKTRVYVDSIDARPGSNTRREVLQAASNAIYVTRARPGLAGRNQGYLLFARGTALMAQPFDASALRTTGEAVPVAEGVDYVSQYAQSQFSASRNGILVYTSGAGIATEVQLSWFDRTGKPVGSVGSPGVIGSVSISPDGSKIAIPRTNPSSGQWDIWIDDLARGTESRFTFGPRSSAVPHWSPDGSKIAFLSGRTGGIGEPAWNGGTGEVREKATSSIGEEEVLSKDPPVADLTDWSPDGGYLIEEVVDRRTGFDIWAVPTFGDRRPFPYIATEARERWGKLSPDGRFLAYYSDESKRNEVYIQTFPEHGGKWQVSTGGGNSPIWSRDGRELYFVSADDKMMAVEVKGEGNKLDVGVPRPLFAIPLLEGLLINYDVSQDGRFLIHVPLKQAPASVPLTVVVNWQSALKK